MLQFRAVVELVESFGIGQRLAILDRPPVHDVAHGQLHYLPTLRAWNVGYLHDPGWNVPRRRVRPDVQAYPIDGCVVKDGAVAELHEKLGYRVPESQRSPAFDPPTRPGVVVAAPAYPPSSQRPIPIPESSRVGGEAETPAAAEVVKPKRRASSKRS